MSELLAPGVTWDLSDLYRSTDDPRVAADLTEAERLAGAFESRYRPLFDEPSTLPLAGLLADYKAIVTIMTRLGTFAHLSFAAKTDDPALGAFMQNVEERLADVRTKLLFFDVRWSRLCEADARRLMDSPALAGDRHFLETMRRYAPYTLGEGEERVFALKSNVSGGAFARLFDETVNAIAFPWDGGSKTEAEILAYLHSPDRAVRRRASESLAEGISANSRVLTFSFNMVLSDHRSTLKLRGFRHPMDPRNLANEITLGSVENLLARVKAAYPVARRYYKLKAKLLGLPKLTDYDRYASLDTSEKPVDFEDCRRIVTETYRSFWPEAGAVVERFFERRWIDAEVRPGKQGGAFSCQTTPDLHPYVLVNYAGTPRDVLTVAHELGHGLHQTLSAKAGILECDAPLTLAETASVFGETLVFRRLLAAETDRRARLALVCAAIDDQFGTVFRQVALTEFELRAHAEGLASGELPAARLEEIWLDVNREYYGDSVDLGPGYRHSWKYIPHFLHTPFYCYAYAFAQLYVLSLYRRYEKDPIGFVPKYGRMLELGGSRSPADVAAIAGLDLNDPGFWDEGLGILDALVREAESLA